jgi:hypothetical protein
MHFLHFLMFGKSLSLNVTTYLAHNFMLMLLEEVNLRPIFSVASNVHLLFQVSFIFL